MIHVTRFVLFVFHTGYAAIENVNIVDERNTKIVRNVVFNCHLSPNWQQMAIKNTVFSDF